MTYQQIYQAVQNIRFNTTSGLLSNPGGIKDWIRARETEVWEYADWPIKDADTPLTVSASTPTIALPGNFFRWPEQGLQLYDDLGDELDYLNPDEFYDAFQELVVANQKGRPSAWTIHSDVSGSVLSPRIRLGPTPDVGYTFRLRGWSLPVKRTASDTWGLGTMSADTDLPWWPDDYHDFLVDGALARGKRNNNDPSWQADEQAFQQGLRQLEDSIMGPQKGGTQQWGKAWC